MITKMVGPGGQSAERWKVPHIVKGILTYVPLLQRWRSRAALSGGTDSADYCYRAWLRHLLALSEHGFRIDGARIGELGPGDSIATGLAALLSGGDQYCGLDAIRYSAQVDLEKMLAEIAELMVAKVRLRDGRFPDDAINWAALPAKIETVRAAIRAGVNNSEVLRYRAPWTTASIISSGSLDLIFSEGVLQCIDDLAGTYGAMFAWLKPGGFASHAVGFSGAYLSPYWNGHWAYSDLEWRLVRGRRPFLLNREPASTHIRCAEQAGFEVLAVNRAYYGGGLDVSSLAPRFRAMNPDDLQTSRAILVLRKPR